MGLTLTVDNLLVNLISSLCIRMFHIHTVCMFTACTLVRVFVNHLNPLKLSTTLMFNY